MYNKLVNGVELGYLMNLKALLGLKFAHDHNWHLSRNFGLDLLNPPVFRFLNIVQQKGLGLLFLSEVWHLELSSKACEC